MGFRVTPVSHTFVWAVMSTSALCFLFSWLCICASLALSQLSWGWSCFGRIEGLLRTLRGVCPAACSHAHATGVPAAMHIRDQGKRVHHVAVVLRPPSERTPRQTRSRVTIVTTGTRT